MDYPIKGGRTIVATTPAEMVEGQNKTIVWAQERLRSAESEVELAGDTLNAAHMADLNVRQARALLNKAARKVSFYEKVTQALQAGYMLTPPFDLSVFAVRTTKQHPRKARSTYKWRHDEQAEALPAEPIGQGEYVGPLAIREHEYSTEHKRDNGTIQTTNHYIDTAFDGVELPMRMMKPRLIEATRNAMNKMLFDSMGMAPGYRAADPVVVGQIKHYKQGTPPLQFFVAWWLDESDLD